MHNRPNSSGYPYQKPVPRMNSGYQQHFAYYSPAPSIYQPYPMYPPQNMMFFTQNPPQHKHTKSKIEVRDPNTNEILDLNQMRVDTNVPQPTITPVIPKESVQVIPVDNSKDEEDKAKVRAQFAQQVAATLITSNNHQKVSKASSNTTTSAIPTQSVIHDTPKDDSKQLDSKTTQEQSQISFKHPFVDVEQSEKQQDVKKPTGQLAAGVLQKTDDLNKTSKGQTNDNTSDCLEKPQVEKTSGTKVVDEGKSSHAKQPAFDKKYVNDKQAKHHAEKSQKAKHQDVPHHAVQQVPPPTTTHAPPPTLPPQQPPVQPSTQSTSDDQGSEWQESKQKRKKKQQQQYKQQLKTSSSNGVKTELSRQSSNPLPTPIQAAPVCTQAPPQNTTPTQPSTKAQAPVWAGKPTQNYKRVVQSKGNSTDIAQNDPKDLRSSESRGQEGKEAKIIESKIVDTKKSVDSEKHIEEQHKEVEVIKKNDTSKKCEVKKNVEEIKKVENKITEKKINKEISESSVDSIVSPKEIEKQPELAKIVPQVIQNPVPEVEAKIMKEEVKQQVTDAPKQEVKEKPTEAPKKDMTEKIEEGETEKNKEKKEERDTEMDVRKLMMSKFKYAEGQWSPMNPGGRKMYSREFLLSLRHVCEEIPKLSDYDIVLTDDSGGQNRGYSGRRNNNQNLAKRQFSNEQMGRKVINLNMSKDVKLHTSENSWVKNKTESDETKVKGKKFRSILNKLTPQRYQVLVQQASELKWCTKEQLTHCIDILFEKAILEPSFASLYARMTKDLFYLEVPVTEGSHNKVAFKTILLSKCQTEFEKDKQEEKEIADLQKKLNEAEDEEEKKKLKEELDSAMWKGKKRSLGNTKFIGELFKLGRLTEKIMHECLQKLLRNQKDEDSLECLCQLFTTIGKTLDQLPKDGNRRKEMEGYFIALKNLVDQKKASPRIRFMISDVIDLRANDWKQRRENNPKMIDQIHKEARMEEIEKQQRIAEMGQRRKFEDQQRPQTKMPSMQDGWSNVSKPPKSTYDVSKFRLSKTVVDENTKLGPPRRMWGQGSKAGATPAKQSKDSKVPVNRFSLLSSSMEAADHSEETQPTSMPANDQYRASFNRPQLQSASQEKPRLSGSEVPMKAPFGTSQSANFGRKKENISDEELERKTKLIIDEYMHNNDMKEALECMETELFLKESWKNAVMFTYFSLISNLEKSTKVREQIGALHRNMLLKKMIPDPCCYSAGVKKLLAFSEDNVIDIPQVWDFVGEIVCPIFLENSTIPLNILVLTTRDVNLLSDIEVEDCQPNSEALLFAMLLKALKHHLGAFRVKELWEASGLSWNKMLPSDQIKPFIKKHALEYTEDSPQAGGRRHRLVSVNEDKNKLIDLFKKPGATVGEVQDWIHENMHISSSSTSNPSDLNFTADICTALCMASLTKKPESDSYDFNEERFHHFVEVVKSVTVNREDRQVKVLLALQELMHRLEHPPNLLLHIFELLYDTDAFSSNAFQKWHDDTSLTPGKGIALESVRSFMNWMKEEEKQEEKEAFESKKN